jgi:hypothetical protein
LVQCIASLVTGDDGDLARCWNSAYTSFLYILRAAQTLRQLSSSEVGEKERERKRERERET